MKIAIVAHGRFHAFDMARELLALGHDVRLLTNYPRRAVAGFGVPPEHVQSLVPHALAARSLHAAGRLIGRDKIAEPLLHRWFSRWAAARLRARPVDVSYCFSGAAEEVLTDRAPSQEIRSVWRGSSHIRTQRRILDEEARRTGQPVDRPSDWMVAREEREYEAADLIIVLSQFARQSFLDEGVPAAKLVLCPLGVDPGKFEARPDDIAARGRRIAAAGHKLVVLTVGSFSLRKGARDYVEVAHGMPGLDFVFRGDVAMDAEFLRKDAERAITFRPRVSEASLYDDYREADLFYFPTLEDGYAAVLTQAAAAGLPVLATTNCGAADFLTEGRDGWIIPIRRADLAMTRLGWCDANREALARVAVEAAVPKPARHWRARAGELVEAYEAAFAKKRAGRVA